MQRAKDNLEKLYGVRDEIYPSYPLLSHVDAAVIGVQAALLLVQQAVEQDDGGFRLIGRHCQTGGIDNRWNGLVAATCRTLSLAGGWIDGSVEEPAGDQLPRDAVLLHELAQDILRSHVESVGQFFGKISRDRVADGRLGGSQEGSVTREPCRLAGPQTIGPKMGDLRSV